MSLPWEVFLGAIDEMLERCADPGTVARWKERGLARIERERAELAKQRVLLEIWKSRQIRAQASGFTGRGRPPTTRIVPLTSGSLLPSPQPSGDLATQIVRRLRVIRLPVFPRWEVDQCCADLGGPPLR
jgi:hypothetical protein